MLILMVVVSIIVAVILNVVSSCYVCYNVAVETEEPKGTLTTVSGIVLLNTLFPYFLGCLTGLWYFS